MRPKDGMEPSRGNVGDQIDAHGSIRLDRFTPALITWAAHRLAANNALVYRERFDVTLMEWRVILHLASSPGATAGSLAQAIGFDKTTISRTVDTLHRRELVDERLNPADARSSHLDLTEQGWALYRRMLPVALEQERQLLGDLDPAEAELFVGLLARVVDALRQHPGATGRARPTAGPARRLQRRLDVRSAD